MRVLVTGGSGFIGKHVVRELISRDVDCISYDIVPPVEHLKGVTYITGTIIDEFTLGKHLKECDAILHLAAMLGVRRTNAELLKCLTINIQGTLKILEACVMTRVSRALLVSSSEIFGDINRSKITEDSPFNPKSGYAISKLVAEKYAEGFRKEYGLDYNIVRFFNIYGPGQVAEFVVPRFIKMVQKGIAPQVYGDGRQVRSFCHISDASRALVDIFLNKDARNQAFNIGNDTEPVTMTELAEKTIKLVGSDLKPAFIPFAQSDRDSTREIYYRVPDISKIKRLIDFKPTVTLEEGLRNVIETGDSPESWAEPILSRV